MISVILYSIKKLLKPLITVEKMSSTLSKEVSKGTHGPTIAATNADDKGVWQANKPFVQLAVFSGCGVACGFVFEKARGKSGSKLNCCGFIIYFIC